MDRLVVGAVNTSLPKAIDVETLVGCLAGRADAAPWRAHLLAFFTELRLEVIEGFLADHNIARRDAARACARVAAETGEAPTDVQSWLDDLAGAPR